MVDAMSAEYAANAVVKTRPYEGIPDLLAALAEKGLLLAVLSNKPDPLTRLVVRETLDGVSFAAVQGSLPGVPLKPDPESALSIAREISVDPEQMLYLGDSGIDMRTAAAASMFPVGALWGFRTEFELLDGGAKTTISSPLELLELL
jgi:phosphoglycolate phosphatase